MLKLSLYTYNIPFRICILFRMVPLIRIVHSQFFAAVVLSLVLTLHSHQRVTQVAHVAPNLSAVRVFDKEQRAEGGVLGWSEKNVRATLFGISSCILFALKNLNSFCCLTPNHCYKSRTPVVNDRSLVACCINVATSCILAQEMAGHLCYVVGDNAGVWISRGRD